MDTTRPNRNGPGRELAGAPLTALVLALAMLPAAMVLVPVRSVIGTTNVALILLFGVVAAAIIGGRLAGFWSATMCALSFNFFHTKPYLTLRVSSGRDVLTVALLLAAGLLFGEISTRVRHRWTRMARQAAALGSVQRLLEQVQAGASHDVVMTMARALVLEDEAVASFDYRPGEPNGQRPVLDRAARVEMTPGLVFRAGRVPMPEPGIDVPVHALGRVIGRLEVTGVKGRATDTAGRRLWLAVADLVGTSIAVRGIS